VFLTENNLGDQIRKDDKGERVLVENS
jgi:hypothetical protein